MLNVISKCIKDDTKGDARRSSKLQVKEGHTPKERRRGAHLPFIGRWAHRWINHYCLWRVASATPDLRLPSQPKLVLISPTHRGMTRLSWPGWQGIKYCAVIHKMCSDNLRLCSDKISGISSNAVVFVHVHVGPKSETSLLGCSHIRLIFMIFGQK